MIFSHILHLKRLSPVWTFWCCPRVCAFLKDSPHVLQEIDFCFVWTLMWYFNWSSSTKVLLQCWQENGLSPEWYFFASQESLLVWMICCIVCMKITFFLCEPHCVFSEFGLFWNIVHRRGRQILTSVSYELSYDASTVLLPEKFCFSADKKNAFLQNDAFHASQECLLAWMICCNICM